MSFKFAERGRPATGFSLTEILIALGIMSVLGIAISVFYIDVFTMLYVSAEKSEINRDIRKFTAEMTLNARTADAWYIYKSHASDDRNAAADRLRDGQSGDFLLLVGVEPYPNVNSIPHITGLTGYYRDATSETSGPVKKFIINYAPSQYKSTATNTVESLIDDAVRVNVRILELADGLSNGQLFYNFRGRGIMVKGKIIHGNLAKRVTDTYNFTVSPRVSRR
jgi:hypothetical protein